ncbi:hypothetical protein ENSA5_12240 [Enhygromyxa salina]|uniref:Cytochrome c domain-containing protein n=1 Tax=Enhygromyxa salina TaxID=215803 RepID=A0A2S9YFG6_9BACT|nr:hypothetical protein [Enhygromyxa salina]PRQ03855.1 hypothetical protein ENSA5_12240 [Enhygromyxa salina]
MRTRNLPSNLTISLTLLLTASLGFLGCSKPKPATEDPATTSGGDVADSGTPEGDEAGEADAKPATWAEMDRDAQLTFMGTEVLPVMKDAFEQQGIEGLKCANCHGEDYKEVDFEMPNDLTPLNPDNPIQSGMDLDEEMTKFMVSTVLPTMAELLGEETDVTTGKGEFGCLSCHLSE